MPGTTDPASSSANYQRSVIIWIFSAVGLLAALYGTYYLIRHIRYKRAFKAGNRRIAESGQNVFSIDGERNTVHVDDVREEARPRPFLGGTLDIAARVNVPTSILSRVDTTNIHTPPESPSRPVSHLSENLPPYSAQQRR